MILIAILAKLTQPTGCSQRFVAVVAEYSGQNVLAEPASSLPAGAERSAKTPALRRQCSANSPNIVNMIAVRRLMKMVLNESCLVALIIGQ